ncbi:cobalt transporter [Bacillus safensis FO-36b] [Bacillus safensis subsp. safensis]
MQSNHSFLSTVNPVMKLLAHLLAMCCFMAISDPKTTFIIWLFALGIGVVLGGWNMKYLVTRLVPYLFFFILVFWMMAAFGKEIIHLEVGVVSYHKRRV